MKNKKIYLGNTLIHDEKEYNEMKESINTLKTNLEGVSAPVTYTGSITENPNGFKVYNSYGDTPLSGNLKNLKPGDKLQLFQLSESGEELSANTYTILSGSDNYLTGNEDIRAILMLDNFNNLCEIRTNKQIAKVFSEVWLFTSSDGKLVPQNPVNTAGVTSLSFNEVKPGDIFKLGSFNYYYILSYGLGYYSTTNTPSKAVVAIENNGKLVQIYTDGSITPVDAETLNGYNASKECAVDTIPIRNDKGAINITSIKQHKEEVQFNTEGWYRIYTSSDEFYASRSIRLNINTIYNNNKDSSYTFEINISHDYVSINQFASIGVDDNVIDKIRIVDKHVGNTYIDIHYRKNNMTAIYFNVMGLGGINVSSNPEVPSDYRTTKFTTVNGFKSQINDTPISFVKAQYVNFMVGSSVAEITTNQFITKLASYGAFAYNTTTELICSYAYSNNDVVITDIGKISLAGSTIKVVNGVGDNYHIIVSTALTCNANGCVNFSVFIYRKNGSNGAWTRLVNSSELPLKGVTSGFTNWTAVPGTTKVYSGSFTTDVTINMSNTIPLGENITLMLTNTTSSDKTINLTNFANRNVDTITVPGSSQRAEINIMALTNNISEYYVRGILYKD